MADIDCDINDMNYLKQLQLIWAWTFALAYLTTTHVSRDTFTLTDSLRTRWSDQVQVGQPIWLASRKGALLRHFSVT